MDFYVIPPLDNLELMHEGDRYFCLAQLYKKHLHYREFFQEQSKRGAWITLDNGAGDHETVTKEELLEIARELQPSELIPLDILFNEKKTLENLKWTIEQMESDPKLKDIEILACPQGKGLFEWLHCYNIMRLHPKVDTIGMSKLAIPFAITGEKGGDVNIATSRNFMFDCLKRYNQVTKPLHFLGAGESWEFHKYVEEDMCRSTDSCFTIWSGMNGVRFDRSDYSRIPTPKDYFERKIENEHMSDILFNINFLKNIVK